MNVLWCADDFGPGDGVHTVNKRLELENSSEKQTSFFFYHFIWDFFFRQNVKQIDGERIECLLFTFQRGR